MTSGGKSFYSWSNLPFKCKISSEYLVILANLHPFSFLQKKVIFTKLYFSSLSWHRQYAVFEQGCTWGTKCLWSLCHPWQKTYLEIVEKPFFFGAKQNTLWSDQKEHVYQSFILGGDRGGPFLRLIPRSSVAYGECVSVPMLHAKHKARALFWNLWCGFLWEQVEITSWNW